MNAQAQRPVVLTARRLRKAMSLPEVMLWQRLRLRPGGLRFRRQHPVGAYVVDFACLDQRLAVEIGGFAHDAGERAHSDVVRAGFLEDNGIGVIRIPAKDVLADVVGAVEAIVACGEGPLHHPSGGPPPRAGEDF